MKILAPILALVCLAPALSAQAHEHGQHTSPYTEFEDREIKALSAEDIEGLLDGAGMQMALPAELNGYPGPRHVLDMADMLALTDEQKTAMQEIFERMQTEARALGEKIVEAERMVDAAFAQGTIDPASLEAMVGDIARTRGALRIAHLKAHLEVYPLLDEEQRSHYRMARGYGAG
jgi:Spy/CpxP family protein refolding chaperone